MKLCPGRGSIPSGGFCIRECRLEGLRSALTAPMRLHHYVHAISNSPLLPVSSFVFSYQIIVAQRCVLVRSCDVLPTRIFLSSLPVRGRVSIDTRCLRSSVHQLLDQGTRQPLEAQNSKNSILRSFESPLCFTSTFHRSY